jgi:hypothetical protein
LTKFKPGDVVRYGDPKYQEGYAVLGRVGEARVDFDAHTFYDEWIEGGSWNVSGIYTLPEDEHDRVWGEYAAWKLTGSDA